MTTANQVKNIFRPIVMRFPYLKETSNRFICATPVHHFAAGVFIERSSDKDYCRPWWTTMALFRPKINRDICMGTYREDIFRDGSRSWIWSDPTMVNEAIVIIETVVLQKLAFYSTPEGYATLPLRDHWIHYEPREDRMLVHIAVGDLDAARKIYDEQEPLYRGKTYHPDSLMHRWQAQLAAVAEPLLARDRPALARILHGWEAANVRGTEIERYWEPTPFPLER